MEMLEKVNKIKKTRIFTKWLLSLKDTAAKTTIIKRIERAEQGNFGEHKSVGDEVFEMRITVGVGYRVYYGNTEKTIYLLLCGGNKATQRYYESQRSVTMSKMFSLGEKI